MKNPIHLIQIPAPGSRILRFRGDTQTFTLSVPANEKGTAWIRTNIGHAQTARKEIIREVLHDEPMMGRDWFDGEMGFGVRELRSENLEVRNTSQFSILNSQFYQISLPLCEVGHFEAKCYFLREGESDPLWSEGPNTVINVKPADTCCANIIYNAFVRQFGPNKSGQSNPSPEQQHCIHALDNAGYTVIPTSGTFRDLIKELDFIIQELGCRIIQLLPIHPTPTTYGRMGRFGSPYASLGFTTVDPALAQFDPKATPMEQFIELVDAVHARSAKLILDVALNHTGWAARLHAIHPEWLARDKDGNIEVPGAWGVKWEDLTKLDYSHRPLWQYMADVLLTWCRRGVDGFRCDAGYMIPFPAWKYIVAEVREQYPDTIFFLEGLGGKISVTRDILNLANFDWFYSELFQNYDRSQMEHYFPGATEISNSDGVMIHFAETHDNNRLAARSANYARMRTALCAMLSQHGGFAFANGVEWLAAEKINVHESKSLNWGAAFNQVAHIRRLNTLLKLHPAFHDRTELKFVQQGGGNCIALLRHHVPGGEKLLIVANLDDERHTVCEVRISPPFLKGGRGDFSAAEIPLNPPLRKGETEFPPFLKGGGGDFDLISEREIFVERVSDTVCRIPLEPGQVFCLCPDTPECKNFIFAPPELQKYNFCTPDLPYRIQQQRLRAKALDVFCFYNGIKDIGDFDPDQAAVRLAENPVEYCRSLNPFSEESRVITWQWSRDLKREVMIPPGHFLLVRAPSLFHARITDKDRTRAQEESLRAADGSFFALFSPIPVPEKHTSHTLKIWVYGEGVRGSGYGVRGHSDAPLLFLTYSKNAKIQHVFHRSELLRNPLMLLGTNGRGGMMRASTSWGKLNSRYDALLAANLNPDFPEDRRIMFTRCRAWIVFQGYSTEICNDCLESFRFDENFHGYWEYHVPMGQGEHIRLIISAEMLPGENTVRLSFSRSEEGLEVRGQRSEVSSHPSPLTPNLLSHFPVRLILRPDIEDRNFHEATKAYLGPEKFWHESVTSHSDGFVFAPAPERRLRLQISSGTFAYEPEWHYMVNRPAEAERGFDPHSDLFSPGYFSSYLKGGETVVLTAEVVRGSGSEVRGQRSEVRGIPPLTPPPSPLTPFIVKRDALHTVIAGYPWFLDWGRDTLIFVRGLIAAGKTQEARSILLQFARFEENGTIPNMIRGNDAGNRDTSDAPLWFFVACSDLVKAEGNHHFLNIGMGGRSVLQILFSMAQSLINGTPNGIRMDAESGLLFSPPHYTWMDTNHPAGTPREGYPIEIQALWYFALSFLSSTSQFSLLNSQLNLAEQVKKSIADLFYLKEQGYLSDCLHARPGTPARNAEADDALRPNQLFALTLGAVTDTDICRKVLAACEELLIPGAIRSLADRPVRRPLEIRRDGHLLNDPHHPYQGVYTGDEDTRRKPAYHNGTAWTWVFPSYCEAYIRTYGKSSVAKETAAAWLSSAMRLINTGCAGHIPEITDGDYPHTQRGCDAQAWGMSEFLRVLKVLPAMSESAN